MRELYQNASQTLVWLGNRGRLAKGAFADVQRLFDEAKDWEINPHMRVGPRTGATFKELLSVEHVEYFWAVFAGNPWWQRTWTAQEILLAKRATLWSGQYHIDCHLTVPWYLNVVEAHVEVEELGKLIKKEFGTVFELFVHTDPCLDFSCSICAKTECTVRKRPFEKRVEWTLENVLKDKKHSL
jgi:hypothetical protein